MPLPSLGRSFFDDIVKSTDPIASIRKLINVDDPVFEKDWLDFKGEHPTDLKQREKKARSCWSEYLSAFANTGGGVVIWGINARSKTVDGRELDFAFDEALINDPVGLASKLNEWQGQATNPPLAGVEIKHYIVPDSGGKGFVICFIPAGPHPPYQSLLTDDKQYYQRGGSSNFVVSRATLSAMFYPRSKPLFRAYGSISWKDQNKGSTSELILARVQLANEGSATARDVLIQVSLSGPLKDAVVAAASYGRLESRRPPPTFITVIAPLHPSRSEDVLTVSFDIQSSTRTLLAQASWPALGMELDVMCDNHEMQRIRFIVNLEHLNLMSELQLTGENVQSQG